MTTHSSRSSGRAPLPAIARRWLVLTAIALAGCASPTYDEVRAEWPPMQAGSGRIVFLGDNFGWYGLLEGVSWEPRLSIDGRVLDVDNDEDVYFAADAPAGKRVIAIDGMETLTVLVQENVTKYVEMQRYSVPNDEFSTRNINYRLRLVQLSEAHATPRLARLDWRGFAE